MNASTRRSSAQLVIGALILVASLWSAMTDPFHGAHLTGSGLSIFLGVVEFGGPLVGLVWLLVLRVKWNHNRRRRDR